MDRINIKPNSFHLAESNLNSKSFNQQKKEEIHSQEESDDSEISDKFEDLVEFLEKKLNSAKKKKKETIEKYRKNKDLITSQVSFEGILISHI